MSLLVPLGLLGLLGIVILILIYILRPSYQQRLVSSTFVWKLSLKYRKKRIYTSRLLNLLLIICQMLIITACAFVLAKPVILGERVRNSNEMVAIVDLSANMRAEQDGVTRFERAVDRVYDLAENTLAAEDGVLTVILAGRESSYFLYRADSAARESVLDDIDALAGDFDVQCSYGTADVESAMDLAERILTINPAAEVLFYTGTEYTNPGKNVTVVDVSSDGEWNAAILNVTPGLVDNHYVFTVEAACYGRNVALQVNFEVYGSNTDGSTITFSCVLDCFNDATAILLYDPAGSEAAHKEFIYTYDRIRVFVSEEDSVSFDNEFYLYGGTVETIRVQYSSSQPNIFVNDILSGLRNTIRQRYNLEITEVRLDGSSPTAAPALSGFDIYIFEHVMPSTLPSDGLVVLINPTAEPDKAGFILGAEMRGDFLLSMGEEHRITSGVDAGQISVSKYTQIVLYDGFIPLLMCEDDPLLLFKDSEDGKLLVFPFSLNYSNLPLLIDFPRLMLNLFNYYIPSTVTDASGSVRYVYDVYEEFTLNARGTDLSIIYGDGSEEKYSEFPRAMSFSAPGSYTLRQTTLNGFKTEYIYVKVTATESNICRVVDELPNPERSDITENDDEDLLFYFAMALFALLVAEWWLQSRDRI